MDSPPISKSGPPPGQETAIQKLSHLHVGQRLVGRVLRLENDGRILIDLGQMVAVAHSDLPLGVGQEIPLKVIQTEGPVRLRLDSDKLSPSPETSRPFAPLEEFSAPDRSRTMEIIRQLLRTDPGSLPAGDSSAYAGAGRLETSATRPGQWIALPEAVRHALGQVRLVLEPMDPQTPRTQQAQWLRSMIENSGMLFEIKLADILDQGAINQPPDKASDPAGETPRPAGRIDSSLMQTVRQILARDLKAQLIVLQDFLAAAEPATRAGVKAGDAAHLRRTVALLMTHVEQQQQRAIRHSGDNEWFHVFSQVLALKDQTRPVRLKVYYPKKGRASRTTPRHCIALLLDMDRMGPVRIDLNMIGRRLSIAFYVNDPRVRTTFDRCAPSVADALAGIFDHIQITTHLNKQKIARFDEEDRQGASPAGGIDLLA